MSDATPRPPEGYTPSQWEAVAECERHLLVSAGAGTGKTHTVVGKLLWLLGVPFEGRACERPLRLRDVAAITFTNQAAADLKRKLRAALREDPDIILVGELRDLETIRLALTAAETGHLVFGTLHTSSAAKTIDRIVDVFPAAEKDMVRAMLSESLKAVISQSLLKTKDGNGRVAAHEIMVGTPAIRNLIREAKVSQMNAAIQTGAALGMQTLDQCLTDLVRRNVISMQEARAAATVKDSFPG